MTPAISIRDLSARRGRELALDGVNLDVLPGEVHGLAGPNGAGKTTLIRCLLGTLAFTGTIRLSLGPDEAIGYVPQALTLDPALPVSVRDFLALGLRGRPAFVGRRKALDASIGRALEATGAAALAGRQLAELSGGELRRALLAQALLPKPRLLVLDEPASHVDEEGARVFEALLARLSREEGVTVLLVEHDLPLLTRLCAHVTVLNRRVVRTDDPRALTAADVAAEAS